VSDISLLVAAVGADEFEFNDNDAAAAVARDDGAALPPPPQSTPPASPVRSESIGESCRREFSELMTTRQQVRRWLDAPVREMCRDALATHQWSLPDDAEAIGAHIEAQVAGRVDALQLAAAAHRRVAELLGILVHVDDAELAQVLEVAQLPQFAAELRDFRTDAEACAFAKHGSRTLQCLRDALLHRAVAFVTRESPDGIARAALASFRAARSFDVAPLPNWPLVCLPMAALWHTWRAIHERCALAPQHQLFIDQQLIAALQRLLTHLGDAAPEGASMPGAKVAGVDEFGVELVSNGVATAPVQAAEAAAEPDYFACVRGDVAALDDTGELMVEYISREELVVKAFHVAFESSAEQMWSSVAGDGNCFFRALTHVFLPILPQACEKRISLDLRRAVIAQHMSIGGMATPLRESTAVAACDNDETKNAADDDEDDAVKDDDGDDDEGAVDDENGDGATLGKRLASSAEKRVKRQRSQLADFAEIGVDDEATMEVAGTWASHVQVLQAAAFLERTLLLLRPDDQHLDVRACGDTDSPSDWRVDDGGDATESDPTLKHAAATPRLMPGDMYTIAPPTVSEAAREHRLSLLFSPWPGHYDACVNKTLASFHVAMTQEDRWGVCLRGMVQRAEQSAHVRAQLGGAVDLFAAFVPSVRLSVAESSAGRRFAQAVCNAPIQWPPTAEAVLAVYSALEFHAECCANALSALERKTTLPRGEAAKAQVMPVLRASRVLRRRCGLLSTALAALPADLRALPSVGAMPRRFIDLVLAPLFNDSLIYVDGDDDGEGIVHADAAGGPLSAIAARFGERFLARAQVLIKPPLPPVTSTHFSSSYGATTGAYGVTSSSYGATTGAYGSTSNVSSYNGTPIWSTPRTTASTSPEVSRHFQPPSYVSNSHGRPSGGIVSTYPGTQGLMSVSTSAFYGNNAHSANNRVADLSSRVNRGVARPQFQRPVDSNDLSSVVDDDISDTESDDEFSAKLHNASSQRLMDGSILLKTHTAAAVWQQHLTNAAVLRFDRRRQGDISQVSLKNLFIALHKSNSTPHVVFNSCEFSADVVNGTMFDFCDKILVRFTKCTFNGNMNAVTDRIRRAASNNFFEIAE
jgi:hypothetical protein